MIGSSNTAALQSGRTNLCVHYIRSLHLHFFKSLPWLAPSLRQRFRLPQRLPTRPSRDNILLPFRHTPLVVRLKHPHRLTHNLQPHTREKVPLPLHTQHQRRQHRPHKRRVVVFHVRPRLVPPGLVFHISVARHLAQREDPTTFEGLGEFVHGAVQIGVRELELREDHQHSGEGPLGCVGEHVGDGERSPFDA